MIYKGIGLLLAAGLLFTACNKRPPSFSIGADISFIPQMEANGVVFQDENGIEKDICQIMAGHHFDNIRLRIFVNPESEKGYSPEKGFCDLHHTIEFAKRIKAAGMKFTLDFHYSDTWADPDKQFKPSAWEGLTGEALNGQLYKYTGEVLQALKDAGVAPEMVQIGNEINHGMVWPEGFIDDNAKEENWKALTDLYKSGQRAVREVLPSSRLMVHLALGGENTLCRQFLDYMIKNGAEFDVIGLSYYEQWHETYDDLQANLYDLSAYYNKQVCVCEYGANADNVKKINDIVRSVPNGLGYGTMAWEPSRALFTSLDSTLTGRFPVNRLEGRVFRMNASKEIFAIYDKIHAQYANPSYKPDVEDPPRRTFEKGEQIIGADISFVPQQEKSGVKYSDKGREKDVLEIMKDNKFNWVRLQLFVGPVAGDGYCGLEQTLKMAKRVKAAGLKFLLDFHYSDTLAGPAKQSIPASWERFSGSGLEGQIYRYSFETVQRFIAEGVRPDMVQVGNGVNRGMLWPQGKIEDSYMPFGVLLRCASAGVRAADPSIMVMVHIACGGQNDESVAFLDKIISRDVKFDVIGQSYYPGNHGSLEDLKNNLTGLATRYGKPLIVVEYKEYAEEVNEIVQNLPDGLGWGTFIWDAASARWGNLFDAEGKTTGDMRIYPAFYESLRK